MSLRARLALKAALEQAEVKPADEETMLEEEQVEETEGEEVTDAADEVVEETEAVTEEGEEVVVDETGEVEGDDVVEETQEEIPADETTEVETEEIAEEPAEEPAEEVAEQSDEVLESEVTGDEGESEELIDEVAEELLEVNDAAEEVDDLDDQVDEMEEAAEGLESIALAMENTLKFGGMSAETAAFANIATESYMNRLGIRDVMPSLESFGGSGSRMLQTQTSIESIQEKGAQVWAAIVQFLKKIAEVGKGFVKALVSRKERIKQRVAALREKVKSAEFKTGDLELSQKDLSGLSVGGRVSTNVAKDIADFEKAFSEVANNRLNSGDSSFGMVIQVVEETVRSVSDNSSAEEIAAAFKTSADKAFGELAQGLKSLNYSFMQKAAGGDVPEGMASQSGAGMDVLASPEMIGNFRVYAAIGNDKDSVLNSSIAVVGSDGSDGTARALTKAQADAVLDSCDKIVESMEAAERNYSKALDNIVKMSNSIDRFTSKIGSMVSDKVKAGRPIGNQIRKATKVLSNFGREPAEGMMRRSMMVMGASLKLVAASAGETVKETENLPVPT